jgi:hypothetical protein
MEAAVRCLRDAVAPDETACCLVLVADDAHVDGEEGMETFSSLLREHADAAAAGRAHARRTVLVAGARAPRRHRLEPNAVSSLGGPPRKDGDALAVVDLTRDPHGWLASIGQKTRDANSSARKRAAPRLGDVASVAAAVHDALGGDVEGDDFGDEDEAGEGTHEYVVAETTARGAAEAPLRENKKSKDPNANANARGRRSGLWGRAPRERARTVVALDCVAELVYASGVKKTLELIENIRADRRVCGVVVYARGGGGDFETDIFAEPARSVTSVAIDSFARVSTRLRRAASCVVVIAPPRADDSEALAEANRRRQTSSFGVGWKKNAKNASSFLEEADALHSLASEREAGDGAAARLSAFLSRPTGRFRVERNDVVSRFRFPAERVPDAFRRSRELLSGETEPKPKPNASPVLEVSFRAETRNAFGEGATSGNALVRVRDGDENENGVRGETAEAEAEKQRTRLERLTPFKLGVSAEESKARSKVVLPFEHQGGFVRDGNGSERVPDGPVDERAYASGDFLRYLPRDAGGESGVAGGGHGERRQKTFGGGAIVYVRDSEDDGSGSAPDSDEELDEDADF